MTPPDGDRARRDDQHLLAPRAATRDVLAQRLEPAAPQIAAGLVDQQRRADLDDQPARRRQAFAGGQFLSLAGADHGGPQYRLSDTIQRSCSGAPASAARA